MRVVVGVIIIVRVIVIATAPRSFDYADENDHAHDYGHHDGHDHAPGLEGKDRA
ncbi:MAG TPA: hypothetical protein VEB21_02280 [Terriglobales bacterium]|nr:hypothetical protein [Terriglobales bacterium]